MVIPYFETQNWRQHAQAEIDQLRMRVRELEDRLAAAQQREVQLRRTVKEALEHLLAHEGEWDQHFFEVKARLEGV